MERRLHGAVGLPPRGRGKVHVLELHVVPSGITPPQAGKSCPTCTPGTRPTDHPRMGGEKLANYLLEPLDKGSPPHGRGKDRFRPPSTHSTRITPAWAGKRQSWTSETWPQRDHPRMGGEKGTSGNSSTAGSGSPPHGRGKAPISRLRWLSPRITPAWAGKSLHSKA